MPSWSPHEDERARPPAMPSPRAVTRKREGGIGDVVTVVALASVLAVYVGAVFEPWVARAVGFLP